MRWWIVGGVLAGAAAAAIVAYLEPEQETTITRGVLAEEIRRTLDQYGPLVNDLRK